MSKAKNKLRRQIMYLIGFIMATSVSFLSYFQSSFLEEFIGIGFVSLFFVFANMATIIAISIFPKIIHKIGNYFTTKIVIILYAASLLSIAAASGRISATLSLLFFVITSNLIWINIDIFLEEVSSDESTGRVRATYLTCMNLGWMLGPVISARLIELADYPLSAFSGALIMIPFFLIIVYRKNNLTDKVKRTKQGTIESFKKLWKNKNLRGVFIATTALNIFYSAAVLYIPIHLHQGLGIPWSQLGLIFSISLLPFILFQLPVGLLADKYFGEKEMMIIGLFILFCSLFLFFYIKSPLALLWAAILFFSRIGAALVEATSNTYFFKNVSAEDLGFINIFRMSHSLGYLLGAAFSSLVLIFLGINYVFLTLAIVIIPVFYYTYLIEDTK